MGFFLVYSAGRVFQCGFQIRPDERCDECRHSSMLEATIHRKIRSNPVHTSVGRCRRNGRHFIQIHRSSFTQATFPDQGYWVAFLNRFFFLPILINNDYRLTALFLSVRRVADCEVTVCDFSKEMLRVGRQRSRQLGYENKATIRWIEGDAQQLPFDDNQFDAYTIAFGIRNVVDIERALSEAYRVLKPGGIFMCLEFSRMQNPLLEGSVFRLWFSLILLSCFSFNDPKWLTFNYFLFCFPPTLRRPYDWYSFNIIPVLGELLAGDWKSYQYLVESIRKFPEQQRFQEMIEKAGFSFVDYENLTQGVAAIHTGFKK